MEFHLFPPQNPACLSSCSASLPCSPGIFSSEMSRLSQNLERVVNIPHNHHLLPNKNHPGIFFFSSRNAFHAIFNTTRALDSREYTNSWKFPCKPNVSMIEKGETRALPHLRDFFGSFFLGALWFSSRNIQDHSFHARFGEWNDTLDDSVINFIPKFPFL